MAFVLSVGRAEIFDIVLSSSRVSVEAFPIHLYPPVPILLSSSSSSSRPSFQTRPEESPALPHRSLSSFSASLSISLCVPSLCSAMSLAASPLMKSIRLCAASSSPASRTNYPVVSLPSKHTKLSPFSLPTSWVSLKMRTFWVPLVAQTSDWSQQEEEEEDAGESEALTASFDGDEGSSAEGEGSGEEYYPEPPEEAKLFVGNLPYDVDSESLAQVFNQAGVVEIAEVIYNRETDQSRGFGFVTMSAVEEAEKAVEMFHRYNLNGRLLTVNKAAPRGSQPVRARIMEPSFRIYVGNLPWQVDDARLEQVFSEHGKVTSARVVLERETGRSRGFGFVTMSSEMEVNDAIAALDGQSLDGRPIRVNIAESRPRRGSLSE